MLLLYKHCSKNQRTLLRTPIPTSSFSFSLSFFVPSFFVLPCSSLLPSMAQDHSGVEDTVCS